MTVDQLEQGAFAITDNGCAVVGVSKYNFTPKHEGEAHVIHLANGIGAFPNKTRCRVVTPAEAFTEAARYLSVELFRKGEYKGSNE